MIEARQKKPWRVIRKFSTREEKIVKNRQRRDNAQLMKRPGKKRTVK